MGFTLLLRGILDFKVRQVEIYIIPATKDWHHGANFRNVELSQQTKRGQNRTKYHMYHR